MCWKPLKVDTAMKAMCMMKLNKYDLLRERERESEWRGGGNRWEEERKGDREREGR